MVVLIRSIALNLSQNCQSTEWNDKIIVRTIDYNVKGENGGKYGAIHFGMDQCGRCWPSPDNGANSWQPGHPPLISWQDTYTAGGSSRPLIDNTQTPVRVNTYGDDNKVCQPLFSDDQASAGQIKPTQSNDQVISESKKKTGSGLIVKAIYKTLPISEKILCKKHATCQFE